MANVVRSPAQEEYCQDIRYLLSKCDDFDSKDGLRDANYTSVVDSKYSIREALEKALADDQRFQDAEAGISLELDQMIENILSGNERDRGKLKIEKQKLIELLSGENLELSSEQLNSLERFFLEYKFPCKIYEDRCLFRIFVNRFCKLNQMLDDLLDLSEGNILDGNGYKLDEEGNLLDERGNILCINILSYVEGIILNVKEGIIYKLGIEKQKLIELLGDENLELSSEQLNSLERFFEKYKFPCKTDDDRELFRIIMNRFGKLDQMLDDILSVRDEDMFNEKGGWLPGGKEISSKLDIEKEKLVELLGDENLELSSEQLKKLKDFLKKYPLTFNEEESKKVLKIFMKRFGKLDQQDIFDCNFKNIFWMFHNYGLGYLMEILGNFDDEFILKILRVLFIFHEMEGSDVEKFLSIEVINKFFINDKKILELFSFIFPRYSVMSDEIKGRIMPVVSSQLEEFVNKYYDCGMCEDEFEFLNEKRMKTFLEFLKNENLKISFKSFKKILGTVDEKYLKKSLEEYLSESQIDIFDYVEDIELKKVVGDSFENKELGNEDFNLLMCMKGERYRIFSLLDDKYKNGEYINPKIECFNSKIGLNDIFRLLKEVHEIKIKNGENVNETGMDNLKISHRIFDYVHSALRDIKEDELMLILDEVEVDDELRNVIGRVWISYVEHYRRYLDMRKDGKVDVNELLEFIKLFGYWKISFRDEGGHERIKNLVNDVIACALSLNDISLIKALLDNSLERYCGVECINNLIRKFVNLISTEEDLIFLQILWRSSSYKNNELLIRLRYLSTGELWASYVPKDCYIDAINNHLYNKIHEFSYKTVVHTPYIDEDDLEKFLGLMKKWINNGEENGNIVFDIENYGAFLLMINIEEKNLEFISNNGVHGDMHKYFKGRLCVGGGRVEKDDSRKLIKLYGTSMGYGSVTGFFRESVKKMVQRKYPDYKIEVDLDYTPYEPSP